MDAAPTAKLSLRKPLLLIPLSPLAALIYFLSYVTSSETGMPLKILLLEYNCWCAYMCECVLGWSRPLATAAAAASSGALKPTYGTTSR